MRVMTKTEYWRKWRAKHPGYHAEKSRVWRLAHPIQSRLAQKKWAKNNPEKRRAYKMVQYYLLKGSLIRLPCVVCGAPKSHAHHSDYSKPLDITWICAFHHKDTHHRKEIIN